jgi:hypothetical protein
VELETKVETLEKVTDPSYEWQGILADEIMEVV